MRTILHLAGKKFIIIIQLLLLLYSISYSQWERIDYIPSPFSNGYYLEIFFLPQDVNYGWACGFNSYVIRTTDGGSSWMGVKISADSIQLESITFVNKVVGFTSGNSRKDGRPYIFKSIDGGASWVNITPGTIESSYGLWGNYFIDENYGLVIGGGCDNSPQNFFRTSDGGSSWTLFQGNEPNTGMTDLILYSSKGLGYAVSSGRLWRTNDGGFSWSVFANSGTEDWQEELTHLSNSFLVPYSGGCTGSGNSGGMRFSTNMGVYWSQYYTGRPMFGAFLHDGMRGWACGWDRTVYYTSDGGRTWELRNCGIEPGVSLDDIWFINDSTGWLVGDGVYRYRPLDTLKPEIQVKGPITICDGDSVVLATTRSYRFYRWSTGETGSRIVVKKPGNYRVFVGNTVCDTATTDAVEVRLYPKPDFQILSSSPDNPCEGDTVTLTASISFAKYKWTTGEQTRSIRVTHSGTYKLTVFDSNGCQVEKEIKVNFLGNKKASIFVNNNNPCVGDSAIITTDEGYSDYEWYEVNTDGYIDKGKNKTTVKKTGTYYVVVRTSEGCINVSDSILVDIRLDTNKLQFVYSSAPDDFDFGDIEYPTMLCKSITIANRSWQAVNVENILFMKNSNFSIPPSQLPLVLSPFESKEIEICFRAQDSGSHYDTLLLPDICGIHKVPLIAEVLDFELYGQSRCGIPIKLTTGGNSIEYKFIPLEPYPNPANSIVSLPYRANSSKEFNVDVETRIFDSFGNLLKTGENVNINKHQSNYGYYVEGEYRFNMNNQGAGIYFIVCIINENTLTFPVVIGR